MTIENMEMKTRKIKTAPVLLTNLTPKRLMTVNTARTRKLKNLIEKAIGPRLNPDIT
jgi:hypothetical protein